MTVVCYAACGDKKEHDVGVMLRDALLSGFLSVAEPEKAVFRGKNGRPMLSLPVCDLSLSHSHGVAAAALSFPGVKPLPALQAGCLLVIDPSAKAFRIGLDIETIADKKRARAEKVARRDFSAGEMAILEKEAEDAGFLRAFTAVWTGKESLIKNSGVGLPGLHAADTTALPAGYRLFTRRLSADGAAFFLTVALSPVPA